MPAKTAKSKKSASGDSKPSSAAAADKSAHAAPEQSAAADSAADSATDSATDSAANDSQSQHADKNADKTASDNVGETPEDGNSSIEDYDADKLRDLYVRALADRENLQKRAENEIKKARDFALDKFSRGICEVCDCLESALAEMPTTAAKEREGVALTLRKLVTVMENNGIRPVRPDVGASFDPALHQAVAIHADDNHVANTVVTVVQSGYTLNGRIIRPAGIVVAKPAAKSDA